MFSTVSQLDSFTDVFGDASEELLDENYSQPLSLPTACNSPVESATNRLVTKHVEISRPAKHTGQHGNFRSVEEIDPKYRCLFTYPYFNLVQSRIIEDALYSDKSLVLCAPTGSGKTVVFELAILQLLMQIEDEGSSADFKIIYSTAKECTLRNRCVPRVELRAAAGQEDMSQHVVLSGAASTPPSSFSSNMAPVKAVCNERLTEWYPKLTKLGLLCIEVTGDTEVDFLQLSPYRVIITTPEKWDMLTRRWRDHRSLVEMIKLFLIDEVHILNDETRGPVLEAVVSRMKTVESAAQSAHRIEQLQLQFQGAGPPSSAPPRIRFVAVSATVGNPEDVANWLGTNDKPAVFYKFGDEYRPVKLQRIVEGFTCAEGTSIFKFDLILNYKLWPIIQKYYNGKPTLIFCNTRKSVALTAEALSREVTVTFSPEQKAKLTALASTLKNKKLQMLVMSGVGCHHAGLVYEERINIERAFRNRDLPILITTTTLAMGVNLPAHLVIVKNTQQYVNGAYQEYAMSTVLQMVGRAGRPQFDDSAVAVIMTRLQDKPRYQALVGGIEPLQSYLHKRLAENLNSEAALGTVSDVAQCVEWLRSTFLYVRAAKDPRRYLGLPPAAPQQLISKKIEELCVKAMNSLASSGLITMDEASCIESTEAGRLMSLFYLDVETMKNIMKIEGTETLERLLWVICESNELSDMHLRMDERRSLNLLNRNSKAPTIRYPMKGKINTRQMKLNCIIQATLGCLPIPEPALNQEAIKVMRTASRICKCLVKYVSRPELVSQQPQHFSAVLNSIILSKCIDAHLWENSPYVSKQLKGIGPTLSTLLASAGLTSFMLLEESHPRDLERIMNKGPPAGNTIRKQVSLLPKYQLAVTPIDARSITIRLMLLNHAHLSENMSNHTAGNSHKSYLVVGDTENHLLLLTQFTDKDFISVYDGTMKYEVTRKLSSEHKILIHCVSSSVVGIDVQADYLFLDLEPQPSNESDHFLWSPSNGPRNNVTAKQTAITDVYKERKRKNENDITECKEKKKREYSLTQKLNALKESFRKTSKTLKTDINKSVEKSNKIIHDLLDGKNRPNFPKKSQVTNEAMVEYPTLDLTKGITDNTNSAQSFARHSQAAEDVAQEYDIVDLTKMFEADPIMINVNDDYIDDDLQVDNILSKIESEIYGKGAISNNINNYVQDTNSDAKISMTANVNANTRSIHGKDRLETTCMNKNSTPKFVNKVSRRDSNINKRKKFKSNYSFMDLIENKTDTGNEKNENSVDTGFSEAIKSQINKFLHRAQKTTKPTTPVIDVLLETSVPEELPEVYIKSSLPSETNKYSKGQVQDNSGGIKKNSNKRLVNSQDDFETTQFDLSGENIGSNVVDLAELNKNTVTPLEPNTHTEKPKNSSKNAVQKPDKESVNYYKTDMCKAQLEHDKPEKNNDFGEIVSNAKRERHNPYTENINSPIVVSASNNSWDTNMPDIMQTMSMTKQIIENYNLTKVNPMPSLELHPPENVLTDVSNASFDKPNQTKILQKNNTIEDNDYEQNSDVLAPLKENLISNPVINHNASSKRCNSNCPNIKLDKNLPLLVLDNQNTSSAEHYFTEVKENIEKLGRRLSPKRYGESQVHPNNVHLDETLQKKIKPKEIDTFECMQETNKPEQRIGCGQPKKINAIAAFDTITYSADSFTATHNNSSITCNKHLPVKSIETVTIPNDCNKDLIPGKNVETVKSRRFQPPTKLENFVPYTDHQNIQDINYKLVKKIIDSYQNVYQSCPNNICANTTNLLLIDQKPSMNHSNSYNNASSVLSKNAYLSNKEQVGNQKEPETSDNQKEAYFKRFSYTATKVDVCTKKYAPDHELRITRKLKVDVDVTEIVKQGKNEPNEPNNEYPEQGFDDKESKHNIQATNARKKKTTPSITHSENNNAINEPNVIENAAASDDTTLDSIEDKPNNSATCDNVENILQKYSRILAKSETPTQVMSKMNKINGNTSIKTAPKVPKSKKPFRITDINSMELPLPENLIIASKPVINTSQIEHVTTAKRIKTDPKDIHPTLPSPIPETDYKKSYESPVSVHSLNLDTIKDDNTFNAKEDLKDESMFNPKLLLQYLTEDNEATDIIAPPADFSDNPPVYSPIASQETKNFYDKQYNLTMEDSENNFSSCVLDNYSSNVESSPKEVETWCFSNKEDDMSTYKSPARSAPWVISQRAHTNLGGRRAKLCQFKCVRKRT